MKYSIIRQGIKTGDVVLCRDKTLTGFIIRLFTLSSWNHVALFVWLQDDDLWVSEMTGLHGNRMMRASDYLEQRRSFMRWGVRPGEARPHHAEAIRKYVLSTRGERYGYLSLIGVWWAQIINKRVNPAKRVCSTHVQAAWTRSGIQFERTADPDDISVMCPVTTIIESG